MSFNLDKIAQLLQFSKNPQKDKQKARKLARRKLEEIEFHLRELATLRDELCLLTNLSGASAQGCPILDGLAENDKSR